MACPEQLDLVGKNKLDTDLSCSGEPSSEQFHPHFPHRDPAWSEDNSDGR